MAPHYLTPSSLSALLRALRVVKTLKPFVISRADPKTPSRFAIFNF